MPRLLSHVATSLCKSQHLMGHSGSRRIMCNITQSLEQTLCYPITFLSMFYITYLIKIWVLYMPFINRSLYKSHRDFSKDKPHLLNIVHSLLNFNKSHKPHLMYFWALFSVSCCLLFAQVVPWSCFPSDTGSFLLLPLLKQETIWLALGLVKPHTKGIKAGDFIKMCYVHCSLDREYWTPVQWTGKQASSTEFR